MPNVDFVELRLRLGKNAKKFAFFARLALTLTSSKLGCASEKNAKKIAFFARLALTLHHQSNN